MQCIMGKLNIYTSTKQEFKKLMYLNKMERVACRQYKVRRKILHI